MASAPVQAVKLMGSCKVNSGSRSAKDGFVYARATKIHFGRTIQLWQIRITDEKDELISLAKLTTIAIKKNKK